MRQELPHIHSPNSTTFLAWIPTPCACSPVTIDEMLPLKQRSLLHSLPGPIPYHCLDSAVILWEFTPLVPPAYWIFLVSFTRESWKSCVNSTPPLNHFWFSPQLAPVQPLSPSLSWHWYCQQIRVFSISRLSGYTHILILLNFPDYSA